MERLRDFFRSSNLITALIFLIQIQVQGLHIYSVDGLVADFPFFMRFLNQQHSQSQPYDVCTRVIYLTQTHFM